MQVGDPMAAATQVLAAQRAGSHEGDGNDVEGMVSRLAARLQAQPGDVEGWIVLARSYEYLQRYDDAVAAYQKAMALAPGQPQLLADYADALASARDGDLGGPAQEAIDAALAIDPEPSEVPRAGRHGRVQARRSCAGAPALGEGAGGAARRIPTRPRKIEADLAQLDSTKAATPRRRRRAKAGQRHGLDRSFIA